MTTTTLADQAANSVDEKELVSLLQQMVRTHSYSAGGEEGKIANFMREYLQDMGLESELQEVQPERYNVVSRLRGKGNGKSLMFNGHLDTNPAGEGWTKDPLGGEVDDEFIYGIGVSNMKAADAAYVAAVRAVQRAGIELKGDVIIAHVVGELQGGVGTVHLINSGVRADRFIVGEPTDLSAMTLHAGSIEAELTTYGKTRHLSKMEEGVDAIEKMLKAMHAVKRMEFSGPDRDDYRGLRRVAIGVIKGGLGPDFHDWRPSLLADRCSIKFSARYSPGQTSDGVLEDIRGELERLSAEDPEFRAEVRFNQNGQRLFMEPFEVDQEADIVRTVVQAHQAVRGSEPQVGDVAPYKFYGTDASHLANAGMTGLVYGPGGKYNTMPDERVELQDLFDAARVYARAIVETCG
jgi:acetylornithine deacetylase